MPWKSLILCLSIGLLFVSAAPAQTKAQPGGQAGDLAEFQQKAAKFNSVIAVPDLNLTPSGAREAVRRTIASGNAAMDRIAAIKPGEVTLDNTLRALDDVGFLIDETDNRLTIVKETSTSAALRDAANSDIVSRRRIRR